MIKYNDKKHYIEDKTTRKYDKKPNLTDKNDHFTLQDVPQRYGLLWKDGVALYMVDSDSLVIG